MSESQQWMSPEFAPGLVSVIIPTYNRAAFLSATLNSVAAQNYRPIEIQLVDDGSTDDTRRVVEEFIESHRGDERLSLRCHWCDHLGASPARNHGLKSSRGEFVQFLDSDDVLHPDKFSMQVQALQTHEVDFVWSSTIAYQVEPDWSAPPLVGTAMPGNNGLDFVKPFIKKSRWRTESGLYRRATCTKTGPWLPLMMFQDWEYNIRMLSWSPKLRFVSGKFAAAHLHDQGRISDKWRNGTGLDGVLKAIRRAEEQTRPQFERDPQWQEIVKNRYLEVALQAELLGLPDVALRARKMLSTRS